MEHFPGYAAVERIYNGARSAAYRARRLADDRPVILKVSSACHATLDEALARLRHELAVLAQIRSERVIRAFEVTTIGDKALLVVDDFGGESLERYAARARFSLADTLGLAIGVVAALRDVHAAGFIHKDIAPNNIVYNAATGQIRLIDFDIATAWRTDHQGFTSPRLLEGTLRYMAPEQTGRMNRTTDNRADLYAFGATLFELLTGRLPFAETDILAIVHAHLAVRPPAPDAIDRTIPPAVSAIVMKLLAKAPEDRYQTAEGLLADLRTCLEQLSSTGTIPAFPLGRHDVSKRFELPTQLYGRTSEVGVLTNAFERVVTGSVEAVLVSGRSGVGKTSVARELFPLVTRARGYFVSGKFDQLRGEGPYAALVTAFHELVHLLLTEPEDELARWKAQLNAAVAPNGAVLVEALPELARIIGPQPPVIALDTASTLSRFNQTLLKMVQVFTRRRHPIVLFLDDMQWADADCQQLLKLIMMSEGTESFLLIEAYRDNEVNDAHPLMATTREIGKRRQVTRLHLEPLPAPTIAAMIADTLHCEVAEVGPLARLVCRKTDGNPFFVRQLLMALHEAGHIQLDVTARRFTFDAQSIERAPITENVADLLAENLRKLPAQAQRLLAIAAAIGNRFELDTLARVAGLDVVACHGELAAALDHELVVPLSDLEYVASAGGGGLVFPRLRFQHDRIQGAAYALMSPAAQQRTHYEIGELLASENVFDAVSHLNRALPLLNTPDKIAWLARLNLTAARKSFASAAYGPAAECLQIAVERLDWRADYRAQLDAHKMLAECRYITGDRRRAFAALDAAGAHVQAPHDRGALDALRTTFYIHANDLRAALRTVRQATPLLGLELPGDPIELIAATRTTTATILRRIGDRSPEQLIDLPVMTDASTLALVTLLRNAVPAAFQIEPALAAFLTVQTVLLSLDRGNCPASAQAYCSFAGILHGAELHHLAYRFGRLGVDLNRRLDDKAASPSVHFVFALSASPWKSPITEAIGYMHEAVRGARATCNFIIADNAAAQEILMRVFHGAEPLAEICHDARIYRQQCAEVGDVGAERLLAWQVDRLRVLMGELESFTAEDSDSQVSLLATREEANVSHQFVLLSMLVDVAWSTGDEATALELATSTRELEGMVPRMLAVVEHQFHHALAALAMCRKRPAMRHELEPIAANVAAALEHWATECPANFEARYLLVEAERASLGLDLSAMLSLYDRATASATRHGHRRLEALCHELHARCWSERGKHELAAVYLGRARTLYSQIGAHRNVRILDTRHPSLMRAAPPMRTSSTITTTAASEVLDVTAIAKATRAISGELELDKLLERMLDIIFEHAGASGGALVLDQPRGLTVAAARTDGAQHISTAGEPLAAAALPRSLIHYVQRTEAVVVLDDASHDKRFGNDDYIVSRRPKSVLCMPVRYQDRTIGVLYIENTLVSGAFTQARLDALNILVSQLAVSLENATLFAAQRSHAEQITHANEVLRNEIAVREQVERELALYRGHLEDLIAARTTELTLANQKLRDAAAERERIEAELRLAQKLESVGRLAAGIAHEINTPVQFVSDNVTFVRDALPSMMATIGMYRTLADAVESGGDALGAAAAARACEDEDDIDYVLTHSSAALADARVGLERVAAIVRSMKDFAHPDRDEKTLVNLNRAVESTLMIAANECKYVADVHTELAELPMVKCNGGEINQAILNLVVNAAHAIRDVVDRSGGRGKITVATRRDGNDVEITIADTGTGIPAAIADKIYDPFFTTKEVGRGTGQGLAIVRSVIVDKHGGSLRFETAPGAGTTFFLRLPIGDAMEAAA